MDSCRSALSGRPRAVLRWFSGSKRPPKLLAQVAWEMMSCRFILDRVPELRCRLCGAYINLFYFLIDRSGYDLGRSECHEDAAMIQLKEDKAKAEVM